MTIETTSVKARIAELKNKIEEAGGGDEEGVALSSISDSIESLRLEDDCILTNALLLVTEMAVDLSAELE